MQCGGSWRGGCQEREVGIQEGGRRASGRREAGIREEGATCVWYLGLVQRVGCEEVVF